MDELIEKLEEADILTKILLLVGIIFIISLLGFAIGFFLGR